MQVSHKLTMIVQHSLIPIEQYKSFTFDDFYNLPRDKI